MNLVPRTVSSLALRVKTFFSVNNSGSNWWQFIREANTGDWQRNIVTESKENLLKFSAVYACVSLISDDIAKLYVCLLRNEKGIWREFPEPSPFKPVLRKPNDYQTRVQFWSLWIVSKLLHGNTYVLKERDDRGVVTKFYVLDPRLVKVLVTEQGEVWYELSLDYLSGVKKTVTIPASEIIHDRMMCLWHPLIGISPIVACGASSTQGLRIQANSAKFFENMSRPSGHLTAPGAIGDETAKRLKLEFEKNFSAANIGRLLVTGDGLKYEPLTIPPEAAQLIEQLKWTAEDVARAFKVPMYKLGLGVPPLNTIGALNQDYYSQCLQIHIEAIESLLDEGLKLPSDYCTRFDLEGLLRMDPLSRAERDMKEIGSGKLAPNEARARDDLPPVKGGDSPFLQQQNYSLEALAKRDALENPFAPQSPTTPSVPSKPDPEDVADPPDADLPSEVYESVATEFAELMERLVKEAIREEA